MLQMLLLLSFAADDPKAVIRSVPSSARVSVVDKTQTLRDGQFAFFAIEGYKGKVTWKSRAFPFSAKDSPITIFPCSPGSVFIGYRDEDQYPKAHPAPPDPAIAVWATGKGQALIQALGVVDGEAVELAFILVDANNGPRPPPDPPIPTPPQPDPQPPTPNVDPPKPATGLRVLFLYEDEKSLPAQQELVINSTKIRAYLNEHCAKDSQGHPEYRVWDKSSIVSSGVAKESAVWQQLWKDIQPKLKDEPQLIVVTDQAAVVYSLPQNVDATMSILTKTVEGK